MNATIDPRDYSHCTVPFGTETSPPLEVASADSVQWDDSCDMLVIGYGLAGTSAALKAAELGNMDVILADRFHGGGTSALSGGVVYAGGGTKVQRELGIRDSPEAMTDYVLKEVEGLMRADTVQRFCAASPHMIDWLMARGAVFAGPLAQKKTSYPPPSQFLYYSGNEQAPAFRGTDPPAPRGHRAKSHDPRDHKSFAGKVLMNTLMRAVAASSTIRPMLQASARRLVIDRNGRVIGAELWQIPADSAAARRHRAYYERSTRVMVSIFGLSQPWWRALAKIERRHALPRLVRARHGVVLATGGFIHNHPMVEQAAPVYAKSGKVGSPGDDGSGVRLGQSVGARIGQMHLISAWRFVNPPYSWMKGIIVNGRGERIVNEELYGARLGDALFQKAGGKAWLVVDQAVQNAAKHELKHDDLWPGLQRLPGRVALRLATSARSVAELESKLKLPVGSLAATLDAYNSAARRGETDAMGKSDAQRAALTQGPYYAMDISHDAFLNPVGGITLGGLDVDEDTGAVCNAQGNEISGLYAAGRAAIGICCANYVSGLSLADCVWSGWRAAESIAANRTSTEARMQHSVASKSA